MGPLRLALKVIMHRDFVDLILLYFGFSVTFLDSSAANRPEAQCIGSA